MLNFLVLCLFFTFYSCVNKDGTDLNNQVKTLIKTNIIDGQFDSENRLNNVVYLITENSICTSTVIHPYIVLTAAHCVDNTKVKGVIFSNKIDLTTNNFPLIIPVAKIISNPIYKAHGEALLQQAIDRRAQRIANGEEVPPSLEVSYNGQEKEDIALIILKERAPIQESSIVPLISIQEIEELGIKAGDEVTIVGFGKDEDGMVTGQRNYKKIKIMREQHCSNYHQQEIWSFERGAWSGDSGGPAFILKNNKIRQIGIASTVNIDGAPKECQRSFYTNVSKHLAWIKEKTGYFPGVDFNELTQKLLEEYNLNLPLSQEGIKSYELSGLENAQIKIMPSILKINHPLVEEQFDFVMNVKLYNCNKEESDCKELKFIGSTTLKNDIAYNFDDFSTLINYSELIFKTGTLKYQLEIDDGIFDKNNILGTQIFPLDLTINYTQVQIDKKINLVRSSSIINDQVQLLIDIELVL